MRLFLMLLVALCPLFASAQRVSGDNGAEWGSFAKMNGVSDRIASADKAMRKAKRLKVTAWTVGPVAVVSGLLYVAMSQMDYHYYVYGDDPKTDPTACAIGSALLAGGVAATTSCLIRAHKLKKNAVQSLPIYGCEFQFSNGASLSTGVCSLTDCRSVPPTLGLGFSYKF